VKPNAAWRKILDGRVVALSHRVSISPLALANDERSFFAEIYGKEYSGVVKIDALSSRYTKIKRFTDPVNYQAAGDFDGRWLVWAEYHSLEDDLRDFTVWSWDSRTGRVRRIGAATRSPSGEFWPSAWQAPVAHRGYATWEQGAGPNEIGEIHVVELASGRDRVIRRGHPSGSFLIDGPRVIWPESMKKGALTEMRAADARTGRAVVAPPALRKLRGPIWPASSGGTLRRRRPARRVARNSVRRGLGAVHDVRCPSQDFRRRHGRRPLRPNPPWWLGHDWAQRFRIAYAFEEEGRPRDHEYLLRAAEVASADSAL
jgi:hypothetical protein